MLRRLNPRRSRRPVAGLLNFLVEMSAAAVIRADPASNVVPSQ